MFVKMLDQRLIKKSIFINRLMVRYMKSKVNDDKKDIELNEIEKR